MDMTMKERANRMLNKMQKEYAEKSYMANELADKLTGR
jgi:ankyrin repeat protein